MAQSLISAEEDRVMREIIALAEQSKFTDTNTSSVPPAEFLTLVEQFVRFGTGDQYLWDDPGQLFKRALKAWQSSAIRMPHETLIDVHVETSETGRKRAGTDKRLTLHITTDDKPFLVDSITAALTEAGKSIHFFVNAITETSRNDAGNRAPDEHTIREATIYAELDPPVDDVELDTLKTHLEEVLSDVQAAVSDWKKMKMRLDEAIVRLRYLQLDHVKQDDLEESIAFLNWLQNDQFSFLGVRRYQCHHTENGLIFEHDPSKDLGILKNSDRRVLKNTYSDQGEVSGPVETFLKSDEPILVAKSNAKSLVHRRVYQDYIGIKLYDDEGILIGEDRFVGLYTSEAYNRPASDIPLLRKKVEAVLKDAPFVAGGHNQRALVNILETYPRDELFQADIETIRNTSIEILRLYKRPRIKLIMRRDRFDRFISAFVFVPRDQFNSDRREAIGNLLADTFEGRVSAFYPFFGDASLVRVHFIIGLDPQAPEGPGTAVLTQQIATLCRDWNDGLLDSMREMHDGVVPPGLYDRYRRAFEAGYREHTAPDEALKDMTILDQMDRRDFVVRAYRLPQDEDKHLRIKLYRKGAPLRLSDIIPTLEHFGLSVIMEDGYEVNPADPENARFWINDFLTEDCKARAIDFDRIKRPFEDAMGAILKGACEDDGFNALVVAAGITWREAWLLRACAKHHQQTGFSFSQSYIEETLSNYPEIARLLVHAFHARFRPDGRPYDQHAHDYNQYKQDIKTALKEVTSLDQDRIIRRFLNLFDAITRTSFYQATADHTPKPCIALKIDSQKLEEIPQPKPYREIFVSSPVVDGVHLRFGPVARGGLRWSDRKEDFRTEVLGLVKAQRVKNAVIVPTGSKGGFYPKQLPQTDDRSAIYEAGREAYKFFIRSLLDVTDNIVEGNVAHPDSTVIHDDPDPYLVVAADKGTAQFSDTANAISEDYGFWMGDAFASGGSVGYDHKVMGITARGGWEAVKRHFRERGKDIQNEPFTVAGVGDMSGDVFGNGMLLSKQIKLIAAFDHRDIFIDPTPDPATSWEERNRLFNLARSSWQDYDAKLISSGGGVFSRNAKAISLTPEMQTCLGVSDDKLTPNQLIRAILRAKTELFWLGGIGTYFKADGEENWRVGDRANDAVRINASEMNMKVVGEGANLGLTQKARIAFAAAGGAINTDAIDNSAGVDSSDHEVNIKILLREAIERGKLAQDARNDLLASMTDDVARHVLVHNYDQTRALSQLQETAVAELDAQSRFLIAMEEEGRIDRVVEDLPSREAMDAMMDQGRGLTRPELSVLMAYAKLWLFDELVDSQVPDEPMLHHELVDYFPKALRDYPDAIDNHRLRREIIATRMANEIVDTCGIAFVHEAMLVTGADISEVTLAYEAARQIYELQTFGKATDNLDNKAPARTQTGLYFQAATLLKEQMYRLVTDINAMTLLQEKGLKAVIDHYKEHVHALRDAYMTIAPPNAADSVAARLENWKAQGAPEDLAREAALFPALERAFDIVDIARETGWNTQNAGSLFFAMGHKLQLDILREQIRNHPLTENFDKRACRRLMEEITRQQKALTFNLIMATGSEPTAETTNWLSGCMQAWTDNNAEAINRYDRFVQEVDLSSQTPSISKLSLLNRQLSELNERTKSAVK